MDDATLLEAIALAVEAISFLHLKEDEVDLGARERIDRIRALGKQGGYPIDPDGKVRPERVDCGDMVEHRTAPIDDPSDPVVPGSRERWELRAIQDRLAAARAIVNRGLVEVSIPSCVRDNGHFCGEDPNRPAGYECPHEEVPDWLCLCGQTPGCGDPECIGDKLWQALNGAYVVDLVGLLIKTLPELPPDLEEEVAAALKAIGAR